MPPPQCLSFRRKHHGALAALQQTPSQPPSMLSHQPDGAGPLPACLLTPWLFFPERPQSSVPTLPRGDQNTPCCIQDTDTGEITAGVRAEALKATESRSETQHQPAGVLAMSRASSPCICWGRRAWRSQAGRWGLRGSGCGLGVRSRRCPDGSSLVHCHPHCWRSPSMCTVSPSVHTGQLLPMLLFQGAGVRRPGRRPRPIPG